MDHLISEAPAHRVRFPLLVKLAIAVAAALLVWLLSNILLLTVLAALLALVLRGSADWLAARTRLSANVVLALITVAVFGALLGLGYWVGPELLRQSQELVTRLAGQVTALHKYLANTPWGGPLWQSLTSVQISGLGLLGPATAVLQTSLTIVAGFVVMVVTTLYFAASPEPYVAGMLHLVPLARRRRVREVLDQLAHTLRLWVAGQVIDMITVGGLAAIGLSVLGVPDPYALAIIAGLFTFVPYFGAIIAGVPAVMVALTIGWSTAFWTLAVYIGCHVVEGYIVAPLVQERLVELPPALCILGMATMATLFGPLGIVLGTPLAAITMVSVRELYVRDVLGDSSVA